MFYLIEPSETNLNLYHRWMDGEMGDECFLADEVCLLFLMARLINLMVIYLFSDIS